MAQINTATRRIIANAGMYSVPYDLERKRAWNVGLQRHVNELTGNIVVKFATGSRIYTSWDEAKAAVDRAGASK